MKLALVISSLNRGGAEGVLARLANGLVRRGHEATVITLEPSPPQYALDARIAWQALGGGGASGSLAQAIASNFRRILGLRHAIRNAAPDVVVSFMDMTNVLTLLAVGKELPVFVSERIHPARHEIGRIWRWLRTRTYPRARGIVVQTAAIGAAFPSALQDRIRVIPNAVSPLAETPPASPAKERRSLVAMGRLDRQKGFDLLLRAVAALGSHLAPWTLTVFGEGKERAALEALRKELGLDGRVCFPGQAQDPHRALATGDLFVLPSRFEGFPNALLEAMACGLPAVAFDCPSGPAEIIRHGEDGWLVPPEDVNALSRALELAMSDAELRRRAGVKAREVSGRFAEDAVLDLWEQCLEPAAGAVAGRARRCAE